MLFGKLKSEEGKLDALASSFLRHGGHFLVAEESFFGKLGNQKKYTKCKNLAFFVPFQRGSLGFRVQNFFTTQKGVLPR